jgi:hypothetical protein
MSHCHVTLPMPGYLGGWVGYYSPSCRQIRLNGTLTYACICQHTKEASKLTFMWGLGGRMPSQEIGFLLGPGQWEGEGYRGKGIGAGER